MGVVSVAAILIFGAIGLGVLVTIVVLLSSSLQSDSDRRRAEKLQRARDRHQSD